MQQLSLADISIVLVEPSDTQRKIISKKLADENVLHVETLGTVQEAVTAIKKNPPDLVVSAMYFEDGTGQDILQQVKHDPELELDKWKVVMQEEYKALVSNQTWTLVPADPSINLIECKWVYKIKRKRYIEMYKERLVA